MQPSFIFTDHRSCITSPFVSIPETHLQERRNFNLLLVSCINILRVSISCLSCQVSHLLIDGPESCPFQHLLSSCLCSIDSTRLSCFSDVNASLREALFLILSFFAQRYSATNTLIPVFLSSSHRPLHRLTVFTTPRHPQYLSSIFASSRLISPP